MSEEMEDLGHHCEKAQHDQRLLRQEEQLEQSGELGYAHVATVTWTHERGVLRD